MGTINVSSEAVERAITDLLNKGENLTAPMKSIGEEMINRTQQRFRDKEAPDGSAWQDNSPVTEKRKGHGRVLEGESNELSKQFSYSAASDSVEWGSLMVYAAMQNYGGTKAEFPHLWGDIPGREFVGVSDDDEDEVLGILADHLSL
ncbi:MULTISPECIES: phage virion morphogenesis protein [unclassified Halomonas]|uniref:phage virion morphogenesis protein n=1 Tax=unclassified Halomonas TaxID=2609666 RepID=UPI0009908574|nr:MULTISPECIES: phage virion morphogenesis protein [unclassified Halomonas]AQU83242.1 phage virion morphogenesis protein [Halomonas sp. 'Soap Lake \